jgi:hypothetical protein
MTGAAGPRCKVQEARKTDLAITLPSTLRLRARQKKRQEKPK